MDIHDMTFYENTQTSPNSQNQKDKIDFHEKTPNKHHTRRKFGTAAAVRQLVKNRQAHQCLIGVYTPAGPRPHKTPKGISSDTQRYKFRHPKYSGISSDTQSISSDTQSTEVFPGSKQNQNDWFSSISRFKTESKRQVFIFLCC